MTEHELNQAVLELIAEQDEEAYAIGKIAGMVELWENLRRIIRRSGK